MTKEEFDNIVSETRLGSINTFYDDNVRNLLEEVYHAGFQDGFSNAIFKLQLFEGRSIFAAADKEFFEKNAGKINRRVAAIREYEGTAHLDDTGEEKKQNRKIGIADGKYKAPSVEEFDECNDEIADMFYGDHTEEYGISK